MQGSTLTTCLSRSCRAGERHLAGLSMVLLVTEHHFTAELWLWDARKQDTWTFS